MIYLQRGKGSNCCANFVCSILKNRQVDVRFKWNSDTFRDHICNAVSHTINEALEMVMDDLEDEKRAERDWYKLLHSAVTYTPEYARIGDVL